MGQHEPTLIGSVRRALQIVNEVGAASSPLNAKQIASQVGVPLPTTYHLLRTLVYEGYVQRIDEGYVLGEQLVSLSPDSPPYRMATRVRPTLNWLHEELEAATYVAVWDEGEIVMSEIVDSPTARRVDLWVGMDAAGHATAVGKSVLAALSDADRNEYLDTHDLADLTAHTIRDRRELLQDLTGCSVHTDKEEYVVGASCLSVPIRAHGQLGALGISFPSRRLPDVVGHGEVLQNAARRIERALSL